MLAEARTVRCAGAEGAAIIAAEVGHRLHDQRQRQSNQVRHDMHEGVGGNTAHLGVEVESATVGDNADWSAAVDMAD